MTDREATTPIAREVPRKPRQTGRRPGRRRPSGATASTIILAGAATAATIGMVAGMAVLEPDPVLQAVDRTPAVIVVRPEIPYADLVAAQPAAPPQQVAAPPAPAPAPAPAPQPQGRSHAS